MKIRKATSTDANAIAKVQVDSWKTTYRNIIPDEYLNQMTYKSREQKWANIISKQSVFLAESDEGEVVGFSNGGIERSGKYPSYKGELFAIYILAKYQRKGLGKLLLKPIIDELIKQGIFTMVVLVLEENRSRLFYESLGARVIGIEEIKIYEKRLHELVYGWDDIRAIKQ
ncbi:GNAT family N-acetyltransferase [Ornithinibacillus salinisoli]|uniref:GNAT family N-acetyltransferase n=1 Tax=Ornithinibacillus salinisoli TaxID=1848459 RepID=A0ABW4W0U9_9BACI